MIQNLAAGETIKRKKKIHLYIKVLEIHIYSLLKRLEQEMGVLLANW